MFRRILLCSTCRKFLGSFTDQPSKNLLTCVSGTSSFVDESVMTCLPLGIQKLTACCDDDDDNDNDDNTNNIH